MRWITVPSSQRELGCWVQSQRLSPVRRASGPCRPCPRLHLLGLWIVWEKATQSRGQDALGHSGDCGDPRPGLTRSRKSPSRTSTPAGPAPCFCPPARPCSNHCPAAAPLVAPQSPVFSACRARLS